MDGVEEKVKKSFPHSNIRFLEVDINEVSEDLSVSQVPSLVYFKNGQPISYEGNKDNNFKFEIFFILFSCLGNLRNDQTIQTFVAE